MSVHNIPPATVGDLIEAVDTPALLLDLDVFEHNMLVLKHQLRDFPTIAVRSHAKAHKCPAIAHLQIRSGGAVGVCCQKVSEAEAMVHAGVLDVFVSNEVVGRQKLRRLCALTKLGAKISVCVDSIYHCDELYAVTKEQKCRIEVLVEVDVGGNRCGAAPDHAADVVAHLVSSHCDSLHVPFVGLHCYNGVNQHIRSYKDRKAAVDAVVEKVRFVLADLESRGLPKPAIVTGAGTGTFPFEAASGVYTEIQPGSYVFMDVDYAKNLDDSQVNFWHTFQQSLFVLSTVMSDARSRGWVVVDAGLKAFALDSGAPIVFQNDGSGYQIIKGIEYVPAGDEHGKLTIAKNIVDDAVVASQLQLGQKVLLAPDHCDPTVNCYDWIVAVRKGRVEAVWPVTARGPGN